MRVFIASTYRDLKAWREAAAVAVLAQGHTPELVGRLGDLTPEEVSELCRIKVRTCECCVVIVGEHRGSGPYDTAEEQAHFSFTQIEIDEALRQRIPVFGYFLERGSSTQLPVEHDFAVYNQRLQYMDDFRQELARKLIVRWKIRSADELQWKVGLDIYALGRGEIRPLMPQPPRFWTPG